MSTPIWKESKENKDGKLKQGLVWQLTTKSQLKQAMEYNLRFVFSKNKQDEIFYEIRNNDSYLQYYPVLEYKLF